MFRRADSERRIGRSRPGGAGRHWRASSRCREARGGGLSGAPYASDAMAERARTAGGCATERLENVMKVAILGANGFIGSRLVELLHLEGWAAVRPIVRQV